METSEGTQTTAKPIRITRTKAIDMLKQLRAEDGHAMFGAEWVAVGDAKSGPFLCRKTLRFQVKQHLKGGTLAYDPAEQGYMTVFEMVNRTRAIKLFKNEAKHHLDELRMEAEEAHAALETHQADYDLRESAAQSAAEQVQAAPSGEYATKSARRKAISRAGTAKRSADSKLKGVRIRRDRAQHNCTALADKLRLEQLKIDHPEAALRELINAAIARFTKKLAKTNDAAERARLEQRIAIEQAYLEDPLESLMCRYRTLNLNGLISLKVHGQVYEVTTPPVPALPENAVISD